MTGAWFWVQLRVWNLQNIESFAVKHGEGNAELSASFARTSTGFGCSFLKEKSKFPLAYTKTDEVLALEELLCGVCSVRTVLSLLRTPENPTHLLCVVGWPASTLGPAGALKGGEFWKCIFLGICASQGDLSVHGIIPSALQWPGRGCSFEWGAYATTLELLFLLQYDTCTGISWLLMAARLGPADFLGTKFLLLSSARHLLEELDCITKAFWSTVTAVETVSIC